MIFPKRKPLKPSAIANKYLFARALFKNVRPGIEIGVLAGRQEVRKYMSGVWWNNDPIKAAGNIHRNWGGIGA
ncbi:TPA: hypothetical protein ACIIU3_003322 [Serratia marcescens]|nr:hypothetical protein [Serratia marcescens]HEJ6948804.1 hypothetical protein [Serratia marcescens]HEJ9121963.1 hypothetical protein [Serratia marcescens]HEN7340495.1 hypothetical protein [Serratia marcescens]HEN7411237.1 hypothetical protein [Serratia marcescens]